MPSPKSSLYTTPNILFASGIIACIIFIIVLVVMEKEKFSLLGIFSNTEDAEYEGEVAKYDELSAACAPLLTPVNAKIKSQANIISNSKNQITQLKNNINNDLTSINGDLTVIQKLLDDPANKRNGKFMPFQEEAEKQSTNFVKAKTLLAKVISKTSRDIDSMIGETINDIDMITSQQNAEDTNFYITGPWVNYGRPVKVSNIVPMGNDQTVYMVEDYGDTKMVQWPSKISKYYTGPVSGFNADDWGSYTTVPAGSYMLELAKYYIYGPSVNYGRPVKVSSIVNMGDQTVYMVEDYGDTKMVQWPSTISKYYAGPVTAFKSSDWGSYTQIQPGNYMLWPIPY